MRARLAALAPIAALCGAACVLVSQIVLFGQLPDHYDYWLQEYVHLAVLDRALALGELPLWIGLLAGGTPHLADPQTAVYYPLTTLPLLVFSPTVVARLSIPLHYALAGAGVYVLARALGVSRTGALTGGLVYMLAPHFALIELPTYLQQSAAGTPWVVWGLHRAFARGTPASFALAGGVWALQLYRGYPQTWYFTGLLVAGYVVFRLAALRGARLARATGGVVVFGVAALALGAAQLLPTLELLGLSHRAEAIDAAEAAGRGRVALHNLFGAAGPDAEVSGAYPGVVALGLALMGVALGRGAHVRFYAVAGVVGLVLCLGSATPLWGWAHAVVPGFALWHMPHRALFVWTLGLAVVGGFGLDGLRSRIRYGAVVVSVVPVLAATDLLAHTLPRLDGRYYSPAAVYAAPEAARWLMARASEGPVRFVSTTRGAPVDGLGDPKAPDNRRLAYLPPNSSLLFPGLDAFQGYLAIRLGRSGSLFGAINDIGRGSRLLSIFDLRSPLLDLLGVRYVVTDDVEVPERFRLAHQAAGVRIWESAGARAFAYWHRDGGAATVERRTGNAIDVKVTTMVPDVLVVNQTLAPGWRGFIDGRPVGLGVTEEGQMSVEVTPESQQVALRYVPASVLVGAGITGAAIAALVLLLISAQR